VDLLLYGDLVRDGDPELPREDIEKYGFVIGPMAEVAPELRHPVTGMTMSEIWGGFDRAAHEMQKVEIGIA
jgi:2-amino-4-hydroxy-6-hydroxymethyldihydropteridine diphosphokinase